MEDESTVNCEKSLNVQTETSMNFVQLHIWLDRASLAKRCLSQYKSIQEF